MVFYLDQGYTDYSQKDGDGCTLISGEVKELEKERGVRQNGQRIIGVFFLTTAAKKCRIFHLDNEQMI